MAELFVGLFIAICILGYIAYKMNESTKPPVLQPRLVPNPAPWPALDYPPLAEPPVYMEHYQSPPQAVGDGGLERLWLLERQDSIQNTEQQVLTRKQKQKIRSDAHYQRNRDRVKARSKARRERLKQQPMRQAPDNLWAGLYTG